MHISINNKEVGNLQVLHMISDSNYVPTSCAVNFAYSIWFNTFIFEVVQVQKNWKQIRRLMARTSLSLSSLVVSCVLEQIGTCSFSCLVCLVCVSTYQKTNTPRARRLPHLHKKSRLPKFNTPITLPIRHQQRRQYCHGRLLLQTTTPQEQEQLPYCCHCGITTAQKATMPKHLMEAAAAAAHGVATTMPPVAAGFICCKNAASS